MALVRITCLLSQRTPSEVSHRLENQENVETGGDVAQLVEHRTDTPRTQVRFPGAARDFSSRVNFECKFSYDVRTPPRVQSHAFTSVSTLKIP